MLAIIKSAIITIALSFISGVLLDHYKNSAPKILYNMKKSSRVRIRNKGFKTYILTVKNTSKKTIHDLNVNLQSKYKDLKIDDARITEGLRFEIDSEDNNYNVSIPFLSKDDEFSVRLFIEDNKESKNKPVVTLRSPENFKKINSSEDRGIKDVLQNVKSIFQDKRVIAIAAAIFIICVGITMNRYLSSDANDTETTFNESNDNSNSKETSNSSQNSSKVSGKTKGQEKQESSNKKEGSGDSSKSKSSSSTNSSNTKNSNGEKSTSKNNNTINGSENNKEKGHAGNSVKSEEENKNLKSNNSNEDKKDSSEKSSNSTTETPSSNESKGNN